MKAINLAALKFSDFGHESRCKEWIILAKIEVDTTKEYIDSIDIKIFVYTLQVQEKKSNISEKLQFNPNVKFSENLVGWYGKYYLFSLNSRTMFFEELVNDAERVKTVLIYYLCISILLS